MVTLRAVRKGGMNRNDLQKKIKGTLIKKGIRKKNSASHPQPTNFSHPTLYDRGEARDKKAWGQVLARKRKNQWDEKGKK